MKPDFTSFECRLREFIRGGSAHDFEALALDLFALQFAHNLPYRRFCEAENRAPDSVRDWGEIPAVPAAAFKEFEFTSIPAGQRTAVFCSSGTTEQRPSRHFHSASSLALYELSLIEWSKRHLPLTGGSMVFLTPCAALAPHSSLARMFETLRRDAPAERATFTGQSDSPDLWTVNVPRLISLLSVCAQSNEPVGLLGTAFNFVHLLDALRERNLPFRLPAGSWALETGGYKGRSRSLPKDQLHQLISEFLGIPSARIVCEYGMSELSSQAYDLTLAGPRGRDATPLASTSPILTVASAVASLPRGARSFQFPPWARARIVSPENAREVSDGEIGLLRVYDLANVYSVMAIATDDLAVRRGNGFELIGRAASAEPRGCSLMTV